jgi:hypothetical protein
MTIRAAAAGEGEDEEVHCSTVESEPGPAPSWNESHTGGGIRNRQESLDVFDEAQSWQDINQRILHHFLRGMPTFLFDHKDLYSVLFLEERTVGPQRHGF